MKYSEESLLKTLDLSGKEAIVIDPKMEIGVFIGLAAEKKELKFFSEQDLMDKRAERYAEDAREQPGGERQPETMRGNEFETRCNV